MKETETPTRVRVTFWGTCPGCGMHRRFRENSFLNHRMWIGQKGLLYGEMIECPGSGQAPISADKLN